MKDIEVSLDILDILPKFWYLIVSYGGERRVLSVLCEREALQMCVGIMVSFEILSILQTFGGEKGYILLVSETRVVQS